MVVGKGLVRLLYWNRCKVVGFLVLKFLGVYFRGLTYFYFEGLPPFATLVSPAGPVFFHSLFVRYAAVFLVCYRQSG